MSMEDETRGFLILVLNSIALVILWMMANMLVGIYIGLAFYEDTPGWKNIVYYILALVSFILLVRRLRSKWKDVL